MRIFFLIAAENDARPSKLHAHNDFGRLASGVRLSPKSFKPTLYSGGHGVTALSCLMTFQR